MTIKDGHIEIPSRGGMLASINIVIGLTTFATDIHKDKFLGVESGLCWPRWG